MSYVISLLKYNIKAIVARVKNIYRKAFLIVNTLKDNLSEK